MAAASEDARLLPSLSTDSTICEDTSMSQRSVSPVSSLDNEATPTRESQSVIVAVQKTLDERHVTTVGRAAPIDTIGDLIRWWWVEIAACAIAVYTIGAQICILLVYSNQPQASWPSQIITLNSLIALLATFCRGSIMVAVASCLAQSKWTRFSDTEPHRLADYEMLDDASRGYWGSFQILWKFRGVRHTSCIGAIITIFSLAQSTFSQQMLTIRTDIISSSDTGLAARAENTSSVIDSNSWLNRAMNLAIYNGVLAESILPLQIDCPTGNCTWPIFPTTGVCGGCVDVTKQLKAINKTYELDDGISVGYGTSTNQPHGASFKSRTVNRPSQVFNEPGPQYDKYESLRARNGTNIANFIVLGLLMDVSPITAAAFDCALWFCVQARNTTVEAGRLSDEIIDTWYSSEETETSGSKRYANFTEAPKHFRVDSSRPSFSVDSESLERLRLHMMQVLDVTVDITEEGSPPTTMDGLQASLFNIYSWIDRLAESMTIALRDTGRAAPLKLYEGVATTTQVTIAVRWQWLTFPLLMVLASIVYLILEMTQTFSDCVRPWKADPLVPLFASLQVESDVQERAASEVDRPGGLHKHLKDVRIKLTLENDGQLRMRQKFGILDGAAEHGNHC